MTTSPGHPAAHLARLAEGRSARRLAPRISTTSVDANRARHRPYNFHSRNPPLLAECGRHERAEIKRTCSILVLQRLNRKRERPALRSHAGATAGGEPKASGHERWGGTPVQGSVPNPRLR